jgi:hypothetical protein
MATAVTLLETALANVFLLVMASYKKYQYYAGARQRPDHVSFVITIVQSSYPAGYKIRRSWSWRSR